MVTRDVRMGGAGLVVPRTAAMLPQFPSYPNQNVRRSVKFRLVSGGSE